MILLDMEVDASFGYQTTPITTARYEGVTVQVIPSGGTDLSGCVFDVRHSNTQDGPFVSMSPPVTITDAVRLVGIDPSVHVGEWVVVAVDTTQAIDVRVVIAGRERP